MAAQTFAKSFSWVIRMLIVPDPCNNMYYLHTIMFPEHLYSMSLSHPSDNSLMIVQCYMGQSVLVCMAHGALE